MGSPVHHIINLTNFGQLGEKKNNLYVRNSYICKSIAAVVSMSGPLLASKGSSFSINLWDVDTGALKLTLQGHKGYVKAVAFSPCGSALASGSYDWSIKLWDAGTGALKTTLQGHTGFVETVAFSPCGSTVASGSWDRNIKLWDAGTGALKLTLQGHAGYVRTVAFSPCGSTIASGSSDHRIILWDADTGNLKTTLQGHTGDVNSVAFSPCGKTIASGSYDGSIKLWDANTGDLKTTLQGHTVIFSVAFSPCGSTIASGGVSIKLWDAGTGALKKTLTGQSGNVWSVAFQPLTIDMVATALVDTAWSLYRRSSAYDVDYDAMNVAVSGYLLGKSSRYDHGEVVARARAIHRARLSLEEKSEKVETTGEKRKSGPENNFDGQGPKRSKSREPYRKVRKQHCVRCRARSSRLVSTGTSRRQVWRTRESDDRRY